MHSVLCDMFSVDLFRAVELVVRVWVGGGGGRAPHTPVASPRAPHSKHTQRTPLHIKGTLSTGPSCGVVNVGSTEPARPPPPHVE